MKVLLLLLPFLMAVTLIGTVGAVAPIRGVVSTTSARTTAAKRPFFSTTTAQGNAPRVPSLVASTLGIVATRPAAAKVAAIFLLMNGSLMRFGDHFVLEHVLEMSNTTETDRSLVRRMGRRFLALGVGAIPLVFLGSSPLTAIGTCGAVLLLDRTKRTNVKERHVRHQGTYRQMRKEDLGAIKWDRFVDVIRLHLYSVLAWSGILHPIVPVGTFAATRVVGLCLGVVAANDIFFPDRYHETNDTSLLRQASGYALAGLSLFVIALPSVKGHASSSLHALGVACIANLYSMVTLAPAVASEVAEGEDSDTQACLSWRGRLKRGFYTVWLWANGVVTAALASSGALSLPGNDDGLRPE